MEGHSVHSKLASPVAVWRAPTDVEAPEGGAGLLSPTWRRALLGLALLGSVLTVLGWLVVPERAWPAVLTAAMYVLGLALGGLLFLAFHYVTSAGWSVVVRRIGEALASTLPLGGAFTLLSLLGMYWIYEWSHADVVAADPILEGKSHWLNPFSVAGRAVLFLLLWIAFAWALVRNSLRQDHMVGDPSAAAGIRGTNLRLSAAFLAVFGLTFTLASVDWIMSIEPHWYSTVFAVYTFSGFFVCTLAVMIIVAIVLRRVGPLRSVIKADHLHDLAKLLFGFATFWAYIWFCQYMLIWYSNIPEETMYFALRQEGAWSVLTMLNPVVNWLIPFLVLLPRATKRSEVTLLNVAGLLLLGHWLDLFTMIEPAHMTDGPRFGLWEVGPMLLACALFVLALFRILARFPPVPRGDPFLEESLRHET